MEIRSGYAEINGAQLYYEEAGRGDGHIPLVLLHAGMIDLRMWDEQFTVFARQYRTIRYDLRGCGRSDRGLGLYSHVMDLHGLFRRLHIERAFLVGCGLGASTAVDFAIDHPRRVAGLVLVNPALSGFTYETPEGPVDYLPIHERATPALEQVRAPVMTIAGEPTNPAIRESCELIQASIPNVKKARLAGTALLPNLNRPVQFNRLVLTFLEWVESEMHSRSSKPSTGNTSPLPAGRPQPD